MGEGKHTKVLLNDGNITLCCSLPHKSRELWMKICNKTWWEWVALLEFLDLEQNFLDAMQNVEVII